MTIQTQESNQRLQIEPIQEQQQRQRNAYGAVTADLSRMREETPPIRTVQPLCGNPILSNEPSSSERASGPGHVPGLGRITTRKSRTSKRGLQSNGMDSDSEDDDVDDGSESD